MSAAARPGRDRRATAIGASLVGITFLLMLVLPQVAEPPVAQDRGTDSFSRSALGHSLLADSLAEAGWDVRRIRSEPRGALAGNGMVVIAEPDLVDWDDAREILQDLLLSNDIPLLLVLPKRQAFFEGGELVAAPLLDETRVARVLGAFTDLELRRRPAGASPPEWTVIRGSHEAPAIAEMQLLERRGDDKLFPLIACDEGVLLGVYSSWQGDFVVLADPDLIANHGFGASAANAASALAAVLAASRGRREIWFDEVVHGHDLAGGFWRELLSYPLVLGVLHGVIVLILMIWAGARAFGPRLPTPPAVPPGKAFLVDHVAGVIRLGKHDDYLVLRYLDDTIREVAARFHVEGATLAELEEKLGPRSRARKSRFEPAAWRARARRGKLGAQEAAREIHRWKKEMVNGAGHDPRGRRGRS